MHRSPRQSGRLLSVSLALLAGFALAVPLAQGCGGSSAGKAGDPCDSATPCGSGLACVSGTCQSQSGQSDGGSGDGGATCGTAPVTNCGPCADGTTCSDDGNACTADVCASGQCLHNPVAGGTPCGTSGQCDSSGHCSQGCTIGGQFYPDGTADPNNACQLCDVSKSGTSWSYQADGTACADDGNPCTQDVCSAGTCSHPAATAGLPCGSAHVCDGNGACTGGCAIGGQIYADGTANPANACQTCNALQSTSSWTNSAEGASCGTGMICNATNQCVAGCDIGGNLYASGDTNPSNNCQACLPAVSAIAWSPSPAGTTCGTGQVCNGLSSCVTGCYIGTNLYTSGAVNPSNSCQTCSPTASTSGWTSKASGAACASDNNPCTRDMCLMTLNQGMTCSHVASTGGSCGTDQVCSAGTCVTGCYIGGSVYKPKVTNPSNVCQICVPTLSTTAWSANDGVSCNDGNLCTYNDTCSNQVCNGTTRLCLSIVGSCTTSTCDGNGGCTSGTKPAGTACTTSNCGNGYCNSSGSCNRCAADASSCCDVNLKGGYSCAPNSLVTCN